jgi:plastocyanin
MKKLFITITSGLLVVVLVSVVVNRTKETSEISQADIVTNETTLTVQAQSVVDTVLIERIFLKDPGFLVVRSVENGRLGQIIEISPYLTSGEHTNITIELGAFYDSNSDLVVVVYEDAQADKIFNDLDQPMKNVTGQTIARFVSSGEEVPTELFAGNGEVLPHMMGGMAMEVVRYTNTGYEPKELTVPVGTMVQFINESDTVMWVASNEHPGHSDLPTFDQFGLYPNGSSYTYTFDKVGAWEFHDHLNPEREGVIVVVDTKY